MSFIIAIGQQPPDDREILIGTPKLEQPATGWDTLHETLCLPHPFWLRKGMERDGPGPEGGRFWVQDMNVVEWRAGRPVVEVVSLGLATQDGKDYKLECSATVSEDMTLTVNAPHNLWRTQYVRVSKQWVSPGPVSVLDHVNVPSLPPDTFGLPAATWAMSWIAEDNWNASGWIGESRNPQKLVGCDACLVTDTWLYDPGYMDRDGSGALQVITVFH